VGTMSNEAKLTRPNLSADDYEYLDATPSERSEFAYRALSRRLKVIGVPLPVVAA
jgi:hypothetical protein